MTPRWCSRRSTRRPWRSSAESSHRVRQAAPSRPLRPLWTSRWSTSEGKGRRGWKSPGLRPSSCESLRSSQNQTGSALLGLDGIGWHAMCSGFRVGASRCESYLWAAESLRPTGTKGRKPGPARGCASRLWPSSRRPSGRWRTPPEPGAFSKSFRYISIPTHLLHSGMSGSKFRRRSFRLEVGRRFGLEHGREASTNFVAKPQRFLSVRTRKGAALRPPAALPCQRDSVA